MRQSWSRCSKEALSYACRTSTSLGTSHRSRELEGGRAAAAADDSGALCLVRCNFCVSSCRSVVSSPPQPEPRCRSQLAQRHLGTGVHFAPVMASGLLHKCLSRRPCLVRQHAFRGRLYVASRVASVSTCTRALRRASVSLPKPSTEDRLHGRRTLTLNLFEPINLLSICLPRCLRRGRRSRRDKLVVGVQGP